MYRRPPAGVFEFWSSVEGKCAGRRPAVRRTGGGRFFAAIWADVDILADFYFAGGDFGFGVEAEALAVNYEADVGAHFAVGPEIERFVDD